MNFFQLNVFTARASQSVSHVLRIFFWCMMCHCQELLFVLIADCVLRGRFAHSGCVFRNKMTSENIFSKRSPGSLTGQTREVVQLTKLNEIQNRSHFAGNPPFCQRFSSRSRSPRFCLVIPKTTRDHNASYSLSSLLLRPRTSTPKDVVGR